MVFLVVSSIEGPTYIIDPERHSAQNSRKRERFRHPKYHLIGGSFDDK
jgi:hypothetical protein